MKKLALALAAVAMLASSAFAASTINGSYPTHAAAARAAAAKAFSKSWGTKRDQVRTLKVFDGKGARQVRLMGTTDGWQRKKVTTIETKAGRLTGYIPNPTVFTRPDAYDVKK